MKRFGGHPKNQCSGKARYRDVNEAQFEIDRARELRGEILRPYICLRCRNVHLTSMSLEEFARRFRKE